MDLFTKDWLQIDNNRAFSAELDLELVTRTQPVTLLVPIKLLAGIPAVPHSRLQGFFPFQGNSSSQNSGTARRCEADGFLNRTVLIGWHHLCAHPPLPPPLPPTPTAAGNPGSETGTEGLPPMLGKAVDLVSPSVFAFWGIHNISERRNPKR